MNDKGIIYYTDNELEEPLASFARTFISNSGLPITSASLAPIDFGNNEVINRKRGYVTYIKQIISCLERSTAKYVFFCEHDVLYHPTHFDFTPPSDDIFYYNENVWRWSFGSKTAIRHDRMLSLSGLCTNRELALKHYKIKEAKINELGEETFASKEPSQARKWGYEPGTKEKRRGGLTNDRFSTWSSILPIVDIRHNGTFSSPKVKLEQFIHKPKWWKEISIEEIEGWDLKNLFNL